MSIDLRLDVFTGREVAVAPHRRSRVARRPAEMPKTGRRCPFCPGHEAETEATLLAWPDEAGWKIRVVRNKWPLYTPETGGDHEVVIESTDHDADLAGYTPDHAAQLVRVWRDRVAVLSARPQVKHVTLFRNRGRRSGSSEPHPHSQVVGLPVVPREIELREEIARAHAAAHGGRSLLADRLAAELADGARIVARDEGWVVLCPYAPHRPYETRVVPEGRSGRFAALDDAGAAVLGRVLTRACRAVHEATGGVDYNVILRQIPSFWLIEIHPRLGGEAGFELETGIHVVVESPEQAAAEIRAAW